MVQGKALIEYAGEDDLDGFMEQMKLIKNNHCGKGTPASVRGI